MNVRTKLLVALVFVPILAACTPPVFPPPPTTTVVPTTVPTTTVAPTTTQTTTVTTTPATTTITATAGDGQVVVEWATTRSDITGWHVGRNKTDTWGTGAWSTEKPASARDHKFTSLINGTRYTFTLIPHTSAGDLPALTVESVPNGPITTLPPVTDPPTTSPPTSTPPSGTEAAVVNGWGSPDWSYEFNVDGDFTGWSRYLAPNAQHGNRQPSQCVITGGNLELRSLPDRKTCGMAELNHQGIEYGRIETRVKSVGSAWKSLHIVWPDSGVWPRDGERDWREHTAGSNCYTGFIHYPGHTPQVQQHLPANSASCVNTALFHNVAVEFTPTHIRGWVDGVLWYDITCDADLCQMPGGGHLTVQNDDHGDAGGHSATTLVDWIRFYSL